MKDTENFVRAYHDFKKSVDFTKTGILPELDNLIWCMLVGMPTVPADESRSTNAAITAVDQRVAILKAVFIEVNKDQSDQFLDQGLARYDKASRIAKRLLEESDSPSITTYS
jgi:hypothetical protein